MGWKETVLVLALLTEPALGLAAGKTNGKTAPAPEKMAAWTQLAKGSGVYDKTVPEAQLDAQQLAAWWKVFQDPQLNRLIDLTLQNNRDLKAGAARGEEARAQLGISKGESLPWLNAGGAYIRGEVPDNVGKVVTDMSPVPGMLHAPKLNNQAAGLGIDASWELDFFGRIKAEKQAAAHGLAAQQGALYSTWVTLSAETALNYFSLRTLQQDLVLVEKRGQLQQQKADLLDTNFQAGLISAYPGTAMRTQAQATLAEVPSLRQAISETLTRLTVLTGSEPGALDELVQPAPLPEVNPLLYHAIPANSLRQRPDIFAAEQQVAAQVAKTKEARAALKPRFTLEGFLGLVTLGGSNLFSAGSRGFALAPSITLPLFHGGQLRQNVRLQDARVKEVQAQYEKTVLQAAGEVRDAMTQIVQEKERKDQLTAGRENAQKALSLAESRYQAGLSDYQAVLDNESTLLGLERQENRSKGQELANLIHLFKALGGGWEPMDQQAAAAAGGTKHD